MSQGRIIHLILGLALSGSATGTEISYSTSFSFDNRIDSDLTGEVLTSLFDFKLLSLPRFDPTLGALEDVAIRFDWTFLASMSGSDYDSVYEEEFALPFNIQTNDTRANLRVDNVGRLHLTDPGSSSGQFNMPAMDNGCSHHLGVYSPYDDYCSFSDNASGSDLSSLLLGSIPLSAFVGTDAINLVADLTTGIHGTCDSNDAGDLCHITAISQWFGNIDVLYTYAPPESGGGGDTGGGGTDPMPVPEPGVFALFGTGIIVMSIVRRRFRGTASP